MIGEYLYRLHMTSAAIPVPTAAAVAASDTNNPTIGICAVTAAAMPKPSVACPSRSTANDKPEIAPMAFLIEFSTLSPSSSTANLLARINHMYSPSTTLIESP